MVYYACIYFANKTIILVCVCVCVCVYVCRAEASLNNYRAAEQEKLQERAERLAVARQLEAAKTQLRRYKDKDLSIQVIRQVSHDPENKIKLPKKTKFGDVPIKWCLHKEYPQTGPFAGGIVFYR